MVRTIFQKGCHFLKRDLIRYQTLFAYRNVWMFLAMVGIIVYHMPYVPFSGRTLWVLQIFGYGGVDIFLFCSGIGCAYSLKKDPDVLRFMKRRAQRILPVYLMCLVPWFVVRNSADTLTAVQVIGNIFAMGSLAEQLNQINWFYSVLWLCYLFAPFLAAWAGACPSLLAQGGITLGMILLSVSFWGEWELVAWSRFPIFFLGICAAQRSFRRTHLSLGGFLLAIAASLAGRQLLRRLMVLPSEQLWNCGGWWYPFILIVPGMCILFSMACALVEKTPLRFLNVLAQRCGNYTVALSLTHMIVFSVYRFLYDTDRLENSWLSFLLCIAGIILSTAAVQWLDSLFQNYLLRRRQRREVA